MISQTTIENTIREWLLLIFPSVEIIFMEQTIPIGSRPDLPYIGMKFLSLQTVSTNYQNPPNSDEESIITGIREFIFSIQYYGTNSKTELENIVVMSKDDVLISYLLDNGGISYIDNMGIRDLSVLQDTVYEPRANIDLKFRIASQKTVFAPVIETVGIEGIIRDQANNIIKEIDITNN